MKRILIIAIPACAIVLCMMRLYGNPQEPGGQSDKGQLKPFMQMKLEHTKGILEGLATEDYQQIAVATQALVALSLMKLRNDECTTSGMSARRKRRANKAQTPIQGIATR